MTATKEMCRRHDEQMRRTGQVSDIPWNSGKGQAGSCPFDGCARPSRSGTEPLCEGHYMQRRRGQDLVPLRPRRILATVCCVDGCEKPRGSGVYCSMHAARIARHGDPEVVIPHAERDLPRREDNHRWNPDGSYVAVHQRLTKWHGPARDYPCAFSCGDQAAQWAYVGPREPGAVQPWGDVEMYSPLCVPCHKAFDLSMMKE